MIEDTPASEAEIHLTGQELLKICGPSWCIHEKELPVKHLWEELIQVHACVFASEAKDMRAFDPAHCVHEIKVVLSLELIRWRSRADLNSRATEQRELIDRLRDFVRGAVDSQVRCCYGRDVNEAVVDAHEAEAKIVHQRG